MRVARSETVRIDEWIAELPDSACTSGSVRFPLSRYNSVEEIERVIAAVPPIVEQLRKLSPYWANGAPVQEPEKAFAPAYA